MNISEDRTFVIEMAKRLTLISFRFWEVWEFAGNRGHCVVGRAMGQPAQLKAGDLSLILGACVHRVWAPGSGLRAPAEKPAQEPHFWSLALRALGANTGPSSDPSLVKVGFDWPRLFQCFVSNN